ncbi:uncharacterized protein LOC112467060 [Temnothorax curvispinosus]|uniref:Uncharacterized protein LOC112467060 n=3 Tax=Temnothorax curvispinosus TaxID=300111 RepID=A0A6J1R9D7_9HYME|nr:uncharacterized protein LOC112467060 [Temnothorax curvispinosus]
MVCSIAWGDSGNDVTRVELCKQSSQRLEVKHFWCCNIGTCSCIVTLMPLMPLRSTVHCFVLNSGSVCVATIYKFKIKMVRCIVKSCRNKTTGVREETVNFFQLPKNEVMREGWLKKIGGYVLPPKVEFARICSVHFSQESFHQGRARKDPVKKRHLLPSAVPTLFLNCSEAPNVNKNAVAEYKDSLPDEVLLCLVRTRTYIRIKENAKKSYVNRERRKKEKKMKKLVS